MSDETNTDFSPAFPPWPRHNPARPQVRYDKDAAFHRLYDEALATTGMNDRPLRRQRHYLIPQAIRQVRDVPGDMVEIGCFRGLSAYVTGAVLEAEGIAADFHIFDSFEGLSTPGDRDASSFLAERTSPDNPFAFPEDQVRRNLARFDFVRFHRGWIPERFPDVADRTFRYVHVDVDLYQPTLDTIAFFWPRLSPRGVMLLDDNGTLFYPGAYAAIEEFFAGRRDVVRFEMPSGAGLAVKVA
ncbi:TylF/MycF/NovP-related O-methyltransferase [uncultured Methylobacterium sp.]|uniref:TylF/MycF/NovP-related O-methyltransferase n=1 Tax=uncultured Methylobacterium sp. TaxID=157278 RepID=UPI00261F24C9|nr:TylF/MycF/NovP-related O-methyltransferase [uncultured Methylobacterium sp.]